MRVIGGEFRGRKLRAPSGEETRPTSDRVRESLFNVLSRRVKGSVFLDAFAGTGAVGIEALSRGARFCLFVEPRVRARRILAENLGALGVEDRSLVLAQSFLRAARGPLIGEAPFDLIYLDPPYGPGELLRALRLCSAEGFLGEKGLVVAEHDISLTPPEEEGRLGLQRRLRYGRTVLTFYAPG